MNIDDLTTEAVDPLYDKIDTLAVAELAELMNAGDRTVPVAVHDALGQIVPAIEAVSERMQQGGRLFYFGAGTPGRIGVLDASEIPPTFSTHGRVIAVIAGGPTAIVDAVEGAEDDAEQGAAAVDEAGIGPLDSVVGIAASGRTPFVIGAVRRARERGALGIGLSCNTATPLSAAAEFGIEVNVGPEFVSGSTRLKAGTAQKLVLNMFSTIAMVRLGKTYGNLMVDVQASNAKLRERASRMVVQLAEVSQDEARAALESADWAVSVAVISLRLGIRSSEAKAVLDASGGRLRDALDTTTGARR